MPVISPNGGGGDFRTASVALTDAQIKALPTTPFVIVPATETFNYSGSPATLPIPVSVTLSSHLVGSYANVDAGVLSILAWGSDWSLDAARFEHPIGTEPVSNNMFGTGAPPVVAVGVFTGALGMLPVAFTDQLFDNALALAVNNAGLGNFTGGNAANALRITAQYWVATL